MTRDELREKVATQLSLTDVAVSKIKYPHLENIIEKQNEILVSNGHYLELADAAIGTIFDALKEPTEEMVMIGEDAHMEQLVLRCVENTEPYPSERTHALAMRVGFKAMLSASPLAPSKEEK